MVNEREEVTHVKPYDYRRENGRWVHVRGHGSHAVTGDVRVIVFYREKELHGKVGPRPHHPWKHRVYVSDAQAERAKDVLERRGYHVVLERVCGRCPMPNVEELKRDLRGLDEDREARRE